MARGSGRKGDRLTKSQKKVTKRGSYKRISRKMTRIRKAQFKVAKMVDEMSEGEQFVDFSNSPHAIYGPREFHKNMLNATLFGASSTACAELSKIRALTGEGASRSSGCEWQRQKINAADDGRTMRVLEASGREALAKLMADNRIPKGGTCVAFDLHFEERWDGARMIKQGVSKEQDRINREARDRRAESRGLVKSRPSRGTSYFEAYIVAQIVEKGAQVVVACMRVDDLSNLARFIPPLAEKIRAAGVSSATCLMDRVFFNEACIRELNRTGLHWIIPCRNTETVKKVLADIDGMGKKRAVRRMDITGEDGRQSGYWMRCEPRKRGEEDPDGAQ